MALDATCSTFSLVPLIGTKTVPRGREVEEEEVEEEEEEEEEEEAGTSTALTAYSAGFFDTGITDEEEDPGPTTMESAAKVPLRFMDWGTSGRAVGSDGTVPS